MNVFDIVFINVDSSKLDARCILVDFGDGFKDWFNFFAGWAPKIKMVEAVV